MGLAFIWTRSARKAGGEVPRWQRSLLAGILLAAVAADPVVTWFRYQQQAPEMAWRLVQETAWPFYLCDWAAVASAWALLSKSQRLAEVAWCWGLGGTIQGLIYPQSLSYDFPNPDAWAFFAQHAGVPVVAILLVLGMGLKPQPGVWWRAWVWLLGYFAVAAVLNWCLMRMGGYATANYGFVCTSDYSPFAVLGAWPWYVGGLLLVLGIFFFALTAPFLGLKALEWPFRGKRMR